MTPSVLDDPRVRPVLVQPDARDVEIDPSRAYDYLIDETYYVEQGGPYGYSVTYDAQFRAWLVLNCYGCWVGDSGHPLRRAGDRKSLRPHFGTKEAAIQAVLDLPAVLR